MGFQWQLLLPSLLSWASAAALGISCTCTAAIPDPGSGILKLLSHEYQKPVAAALANAGPNKSQLLKTLQDSPAEAREGMALLIANMPGSDLHALDSGFLASNVRLAYQVREEVPWGKDIPPEIFLNDVLPYACLNERRDDWRQDLHDRFSPRVRDCKTPGEAALCLNEAIFQALKVRYHPTLRPKPNQSPAESMAAGYASCSGLSILLVDACRALGVPARTAGIPAWTVPKGDANGNHAGNHTWVEVWDRQWHYLGASEVSKLDHTWFSGNAGNADPTQPAHRIYASSFRKTGLSFPMVWDLADNSVNAFDVTAFYKPRSHVRLDLPQSSLGPWLLTITLADQIVAAEAAASTAEFSLPGGEQYQVSLQSPDGYRRSKHRIVLTADPDQVVRLK